MPIREIESIFADLHVHTTSSDGTLSIIEIIDQAEKLGLPVFSVTDHDSISAFTNEAYTRLLQQGGCALSDPVHNIRGLKVVTGIEFSTADEPGMEYKDVHIVGLGVDVTNPELVDTLKRLADARFDQKVETVKVMSEKFGFDISFEEVAARSSGNIGKPHIVETILEKSGHAPGVTGEQAEKRQTMKEELYRLLDGPARVEKSFILDIQQSIDLIHRSGGIAILAHPGLHLDDEAMIRACVDMGVDGMEVYYAYDFSPYMEDVRPETCSPLISRYLDLCLSQGLLISGGSDFHGSIKAIDLAEAGVDAPMYEKLLQAMQQARASYQGAAQCGSAQAQG